MGNVTQTLPLLIWITYADRGLALGAIQTLTAALLTAKGSLKNKSRVKKQSSNIMTLGFLVLCLLKMRGFGCKQRHRVVFQFPNPMD